MQTVPQNAPAKKGQEKETNPLKRTYDSLSNYIVAGWIMAIVVLGLSAGIVSKHPGAPLRAAAAYNLALVSS
jgi:hypothetical protein